YGELYPVTMLGKVACVLYAMVGVPLMLLVILDVGDFLALLMTRAYRHLYRLVRILKNRKYTPWKKRRKSFDLQTHRTLEDRTLVFGQNNVVIQKPLDIRQVLHSQAGVRQKSIHLQNNKEIFERILAREQLLHEGPLNRSVSCPELDRLPRSKKPFVLWDFSGLGDDMDKLDVPFFLIIFLVFAYVLLVGLVLPLWETELSGFDAFYFCFITVTTIGFGDIVPKHPNFFMLTSLFIISGMAIVSMAFKLSQSRIVNVYRKCIKYVNPRKDARRSHHGN
ncbi:potassium channel subfamily K member 18, partial [Eucyclogobius newberryi]|uniref:potassium channel subfamily K member 18 n=1 Tax=Eucyclogobius newberryi TaxID=166745 RepID=UPI003B592190